jgi:hypothetical protein
MLEERVADRVHEVGLALPRAAVEEQRAEPDGARLGEHLGGIERDLVGRIDDESRKRVARIERRTFSGHADRGQRHDGRRRRLQRRIDAELHRRLHRVGDRLGSRLGFNR